MMYSTDQSHLYNISCYLQSDTLCLHKFIVLPLLLQQPMAAHHASYEPLPREWHAAVAVGSKLHM